MKRYLTVLVCGLCLLGAVAARAADTDSLAQMVTMIREGDEDALGAALKPLSLKTGIDAPDAQGRTLLDHALCAAPAYNAADVVNLLLANGARAAGQPGSPVHLAALLVTQAPLPDVQAALAALRGGEWNAPFVNGMSPWLWAAALGGDPACVAILVQAGADAAQCIMDGEHAPDKVRENAMTLMARYNANPAMVQALKAQGLDVNAAGEGGTPLIYAARGRNPAMIEALLAAGADARATGPVGETVFTVAAAWADVPLLQKLVAAGADPRAVMDGGSDALYQAASDNIRVDVLRYLVSLGLDATSQLDENYDGLTPLMLAVRRNQNPQVIRCLLELGAKPGLRDADGKTALQGASPERLAWLRQQGLEALLR